MTVVIVIVTSLKLDTAAYRLEVGRTVPDLIGSLQRGDQFSEVNILQEWISKGDVNQISPQVMGDIFAAIKSQNSDPIFADIIGKVNFTIACFRRNHLYYFCQFRKSYLYFSLSNIIVSRIMSHL